MKRAEEIGLSGADFVRFIIESSVVEGAKRCLKLGPLAAAIEQRLWDSPWHVDEGALAAGYGDYPFPEHGLESDRMMPLIEIAAHLKASLASADMDELKLLLEKNFWELIQPWHAPASASIRRLMDANVINGQPPNYDRFEFPRAIRAAHRQRLL